MVNKHFVTEDIDKVMQTGLAVHAAGGERIGSVREYSAEAGYLVVQTGLVVHKDLYVPYSAIQSIDPREVYLSLNKDTLIGNYTAPPPAAIVDEGRSTSTVVSNGYDGSPARVNQVDLESVRRDLAGDMAVYTSDGEKIGAVDGIDDKACYMLVKQHHFSKPNLFIPFAAISSIDREFEEVFLAISKDVVQKDFARLPGGTSAMFYTASATVVEEPGDRR